MKHKIAGINYYEEAIKQIADENPDYDLSNRELLDRYYDGDRIWKYEFYSACQAELRPEPENPYDKNAIAVYALSKYGHVKIGNVKAGSTGRVATDRIYTLEIGGGPFKELCEDEDGKISVERDEHSFSGYFYLPEEESSCGSAPAAATYAAPEPVYSAPAMPAAEPKKKKSKAVLLLLWLFLGLFGGHKFYEGKTGLGFLYLFTVGLFVVGWIIDFFKIIKYPSRF